MMRWLLARVIEDTFKTEFSLNRDRAMLLEFKISTKPDEHGYRNMQMLLWAPSNYVQVWVREVWHLWEQSDRSMSGNTEWALAMDHDSGWRNAIQEVLSHYEDRISTWGGPLQSWYQNVEVPNGLNKSNLYKRPR